MPIDSFQLLCAATLHLTAAVGCAFSRTKSFCSVVFCSVLFYFILSDSVHYVTKLVRHAAPNPIKHVSKSYQFISSNIKINLKPCGFTTEPLPIPSMAVNKCHYKLQ